MQSNKDTFDEKHWGIVRPFNGVDLSNINLGYTYLPNRGIPGQVRVVRSLSGLIEATINSPRYVLLHDGSETGTGNLDLISAQFLKPVTRLNSGPPLFGGNFPPVYLSVDCTGNPRQEGALRVAAVSLMNVEGRGPETARVKLPTEKSHEDIQSELQGFLDGQVAEYTKVSN